MNGSPLDIVRVRSIQLFTYLRELAQLRSKVIRTLNDYESVLWFSDIPREQECFTQAWGAQLEGHEDVWLEIKKPKTPRVPSVPDELRPWVREADLADSSKDEPELLQRILSPNQEEGSEPKFLELDDHFHLLDVWASYLEQKWKPWANEHRRLKSVQDVYTKLFEIYQKQKSLGEEFELVIGFGLLNWLTSNNQRVYRHIITAQAAIMFDPDRGILSVGPPVDGAKPMLEKDMLEVSERPIPEVESSIEQQINAIGDDIWNLTDIEVALRSWVQTISSEGEYSGQLDPTTETMSKPFVSYSPTLVLRKRTERSLLRVYQEIIEQLKSGVEIPAGILRTVEIIDDHKGVDVDQNPGGMEGGGVFNEILFPLPANAEQQRIIDTLNTHQGVLVQGPPGTGKSHTIVNLICHLLAAGKRVLVTGQAPRALKVLKEKILKEESTKEIAALCVSLLGNDNFALKDLEDSVHGITDRHHNWDAFRNAELVDSLREELNELRKQEARLTRRLREIRESETYQHNICDGAYQGTAQRIAQLISEDQIKHGWLQTQTLLNEEPPLTNQETLELLGLYRELSPERVEETEKPTVPPNELPAPEDFVRYRDAEMLAHTNYQAFADLVQSEVFKKLKAVSTDRRHQLKTMFDELLAARASVLKHVQPWVGKAVDDILSDRDRSWRELYNKSCEFLNGLLAEARSADNKKLFLPPDHDRVVIIADAQALIDHLQRGGGFGIPGIRPRPVKLAWYLIKETRVDGRLCDNVDSLKSLITTLTVNERLDRLWSDWKPFATRIAGSRSAQVGELEDLCEPLQAALHLHELLEHAKAVCRTIEGFPLPAWHIVDEVEFYRRALEGIDSEQNLERAKIVFTKADQIFRTVLTKPNVHPVVKAGYHALVERDEQVYGVFYAKTMSLEADRHRLARRIELETRLRSAAPTIAENIAIAADSDFWDTALSHFTESWRWAFAGTWLKSHIANISGAQLSQELIGIQKRINVTTGRLAAVLAWQHCFHRLKESERQHLVAWKQAMRSIGKGTGKYAEKHRREARGHVEGCRSAIPVWIMPLYRVAETVKPAPYIYDVVIIDEASQAGPDALFLMYIAKKIVVVGDDMQISPDSIGVLRDDVDRLRERYLEDLPSPHVRALGVDETSFFHLAEVLFGGRIRLREHFRCMPEIIQFSNDLCYQSEPLIPLRQYPPNRLTPTVKPSYVPDGYREGDTRTARNPSEAQAIVDEIARRCQDPAYKDKTMGVISLLGEHQAHLIRQKLMQVIGPEEMERRNLICGDAYAFQGDERDIIFLSLVAAPDETGMRALTDQKSMRRFNVAASRARDQMWLFHTPTINDFRNKECLRYRLLTYCLNPNRQPSSIEGLDLEQLKVDARTVKRTADNHPQPFGSWFEVDVLLKVIDKGYRVIPQFEVARYFIDMVVEGMRGRLAIECDGDQWHGPDQYDDDMRRQRILERCGWVFWRIRGSEFYHDPERAMASLWDLLNKFRIAPGGKDIEYTNNQAERTTRATTEAQQTDEEVHTEGPDTETGGEDIRQRDFFRSQPSSFEVSSRSELLEALLAVIPSQEKMLRGDAIRAAAMLLKDKGGIKFQRLREGGDIWNEFKSAITDLRISNRNSRPWEIGRSDA